MRRHSKKSRRNPSEEDAVLNEFMENIAPRAPMLKIYRFGDDKSQTFLCAMSVDDFSYESIRERFGAGKYLVRSVRSNGTYGPSRVIRLADRWVR